MLLTQFFHVEIHAHLHKKLNHVSKTKDIFKLCLKVTFNRRLLSFALNKETKLWSDFGRDRVYVIFAL